MAGSLVAVEAHRRQRHRLTGIARSVGVALLTVVLVRLALAFVTDPSAPERFLVRLYETLGAGAAAEALREFGLAPGSRRALIVVVGLLVGTVGTWTLYRSAAAVVEHLGDRWSERVLPWVFVGPGLALLGLYLVFPTVSTIAMSITEDAGFVANYRFALTDPAMRIAFRNNVLWLVFGTGGSVLLGLVIAGLVDRIRHEALAKTVIFLPMAISFVGASVIWRFVYAWRPAGETQIGILNAAVTRFGLDPIPWIQSAPLNTFAFIAIMVWLQTGFAMVVLSAAIKGVDPEMLDAARIDGASELQVFRHVIVPAIRPSTITVGTTIFIAILKVFDIVFVLTGGNFETEVVANRLFTEMFRFRAFGRASALAVLLLIATLPVVVLNVRNLRRTEAGT